MEAAYAKIECRSKGSSCDKRKMFWRKIRWWTGEPIVR